MKTDTLFEAFPPVPDKQWKQQIQADLKGGDYNELLTWTSPEGIQVKPFYTETDRKEPGGVPPRKGPWAIGYTLDMGEGEDPAARAREALDGGADALVVTGAGHASLEGFSGLPEDTPLWVAWDHLEAKLPESIPATLKGQTHLMADPIGGLLATGNWCAGMEADLEKPGEARGSQTVLGIRASLYQEAGANRMQELAYTLAHGLEYLLRAETDPGLKALVENPVFRVAIGGDYFMEIAKLRALRQGWALLARAYGASGDCRILATPSRRNKTLYDYNTNMLRTTSECMSAILGGADLVCNLPYDALYHLPNAFGDRMARNQLLLLRHESYFSEVGNPADGAYYIEALTDQLGRKSLELLKTLEKGGGLLAQLKTHQIQKKIRESHAREQEAFNAGERILVGSNAYPNPDDRMSGELERPVFPGKRGRKTLIEPLPLRRLAAGYEQKRMDDEAR
ncbi:methylmalonyl-CoA mutase subunit beta [Robiginitalea sp. M366]|uniref:methylmalonyl-CoA mutase subunit beta n=1 Tax=Robiginitalea aestuariiviva TaxID=3036903 RepID=UPI00240E20F2|nr:methylmalonyl-CoA mutase subunit beta [Robiginitalea aestuariiviva]MDG1573258.1 methylmalonyl-CoA mutase subunit beta [Robiginitalea aestuariiviva]